MGITDYLDYFAETSGLPQVNLVLLSGNLELDLSYRLGELSPTGNFERMLRLLDQRTPIVEVEQNDKIAAVSSKAAKSQRLRASSRAFMRSRFPDQCKYLVRTSRRYESIEKPHYLDDWWINLHYEDLLKNEFVVLALALDNFNREFKVLSIPTSYLLNNLEKMNVNDAGWINLYIDFNNLCDIRHEAHIEFGQFALN